MRALAGVTLSVRDGEHLALLGSSGSGKTTLVRAVLGAVAFEGAIRVGGLDPSSSEGSRTIRGRCGVVRQGSDLVTGLSGRLNASMGTVSQWTLLDWVQVALFGSPKRYGGLVADLAEQHNVTDCLDARVEELSGGQRQRLALVRALLPNPGLVLADEPTAGLDPAATERVVAALRSTRGTLVVTTHDLEVARTFPRIVALRAGRVVHDGSSIDAATEAMVYR